MKGTSKTKLNVQKIAARKAEQKAQRTTIKGSPEITAKIKRHA